MRHEVDNMEYERLFEAFRTVYRNARPPRIPEDASDIRDPHKVCWIPKNIWLAPDSMDAHDVQFAAWHGEAWISQTGKIEGLWFCLGIEFKDVFRIVLPHLNQNSFAELSIALPEFRISLGKAGRSSADYTPVYNGRFTKDADYGNIFQNIRLIMSHKGLPRPHLQIYKQIGKWCDPDNKVHNLVAKIEEAEQQLTPLVQLVTAGGYRPELIH